MEAADLSRRYLTSLFRGMRRKAVLDRVPVYFMFIGYPRSGHSLVGALLDAHPNIVCAYELGALKYLLAGFSRYQILSMVIDSSRAFVRRGLRADEYNFRVPGQWQGRFSDLLAVGDKHGDGAVLRLHARPWLLARLRRKMARPVRFIHVLRNPFDNISTISRKHGMSLSESTDYYFFLCRTVERLRREIAPEERMEFRHEAFVSNPAAHMASLCRFMGVPVIDAYIAACASIVFAEPRRTRSEAAWDRRLIRSVASGIARFDFLRGYSYE
jgi:hypothetical protein